MFIKEKKLTNKVNNIIIEDTMPKKTRFSSSS